MLFKKPRIKKINDTTFSIKQKTKGIAGDIIVEIGNLRSKYFKPHLKLSKWDEECFLKINIETAKKISPKRKNGKIIWEDACREVRFYPLRAGGLGDNLEDWWQWMASKTKQCENGGMEFEIILKKKPRTNKIVFDIKTKGLRFYYQPFLTEEEKLSMQIVRPKNVEGSYAVYHESQDKIWKTKEEGEKYGAGKAFHIYRPRIEDSAGNKVWGELNIDEKKGKMIVTIPQDFLNNAVYPVKHAAGATFGYETIGGSQVGLQHNISGSIFAGAPGTGTSITAYIYPVATSFTFKFALYANGNSKLVGQTAQGTGVSAAGWRTLNFNNPAPQLIISDYVICAWSNYIFKSASVIYFDAGSANQGHAQSQTYGTWPTTASFTHSTNKCSIYCTYTPGEVMKTAHFSANF